MALLLFWLAKLNMNRKVSLVFFLLIVVVAITVNGTSGIAVGGNAVQVKTSPQSIVFALALNVLFFASAASLNKCDMAGKVGILRRVEALLVDLTFFVIAITPLTALIFVFSEYAISGTFSWQVIRNPASGLELWIANGVVLLSIILFFLYYYFTLLLSVPTLGQSIAGYVIAKKSVGTIAPLQAISMILLSLTAIAIWPITLLVYLLKQTDRQLWYERSSIFIARPAR